MQNTADAANFIANIVSADLENGKNNGKVITRFPPEPNGYLHLGHVKSICLNFGIAQQFAGSCNLRFDDTNPDKENEQYSAAIEEDVRWLGYQWQNLHHASDYFNELLQFAYQLIDKGLAYVDSQSAAEIKNTRGTLTTAGSNSPYRERSTLENRALFDKMVAGEFADGSHVLRAKIDMAAANINMRDPIFYRIRRDSAHFHAGDTWKVYPLYDYTHCLSDMLEGITHSLCTLEFEDHRPLYDWFLKVLETPCHPQQIEFSRLNLEYTVLSKRRLIQLVTEKHVAGWDDPRLPTIAGMRRRGIPARALREFCRLIGINKSDGTVAMDFFEGVIRNDLNHHAARRMLVLEPLKATIKNWQQPSITLQISNHPQNENMGQREVQFSQTLYIEKSDFSNAPPKKWKRLARGAAVRLRGSYVIRCDEVICDEHGAPIELICSYDGDTLGKNPKEYKANGVIHWVDAASALNCSVRHYERLFNHPNPASVADFSATLNPNSLQTFENCKVEAAALAPVGTSYQFERQGYYCVDNDSCADNLVFNRTVGLRDNYSDKN